MLYQLINIVRVHPNGYEELKQVVKTAGSLVLQNGGIIRNVQNLGTKPLPKVMKRHRQSHVIGHHFILQFYSSVSAQKEVHRTLNMDPRIIRSTVFKLADKLEELPRN